MTCPMAMIAVVTTIVDFHLLILGHEVRVYNYNNKLCEVTHILLYLYVYHIDIRVDV